MIPIRQNKKPTLHLIQIDTINYVIKIVCRNYLKCFNLYFSFNRFFFFTSLKIDLVEEVYNLKQVFHLIYDLSVAPVEALHYFSLIS